MVNNYMLYIVSFVISVASGALVWAEKSAPSSTPTIVNLWPKDQMPGRGLKGPEKELPSRGDNVIRITGEIKGVRSLFTNR